MNILGYKFDTQLEADLAVIQCDSFYGIPRSPEDVTQHWTDYQLAEFNLPQFWYIYFDESLVPVLGQPTNFDLELPPAKE